MSRIVDLGSVGPVGSAVIGFARRDEAGLSVSAAGDFNGDGIDDFIVGSNGSAYLIFGQEGGIGTVDLADLHASDGFEISTDQFGHRPGSDVSAAGDINGDGFDDLIVGGNQYGVRNDYGSIPTAYVVFGRSGEVDTIDVSTFHAAATSDGFRIFGEFAIDDYSGARVASAGDINGDGFDDMVVGTPYRDAATGAAYVIFGKAGGFANIDLENLDPATGFAIIGDLPDDHLGFSLSGAGDVNGDGYDDIIIGAKYGNAGGTDSGQAYVIFGKETGFGTIDLSDLDPAAGFVIHGDEHLFSVGWSVSAAGDVNGDGFDDVIVGAPYADGGAGRNANSGAGEAYVVFGRAVGFGAVDLSSLKRNEGFTIRGDDPGDLAGWSVSGAGDLNADGFDDIIVGAPGGDSGGADAGEAYVIFGEAHGPGTIDLARLESGRGRADGFMIQGDVANDRAGWSVSDAGDIDGDGVDDLIVGAPWNDFGALGVDWPGAPLPPEDLNSGQAYVLYGAELAEFFPPLKGHGQGHGDAHLDLFW